jgi:hypothetical protein
MRMETKHRKFFYLCVTLHSFEPLLAKPIRTFLFNLSSHVCLYGHYHVDSLKPQGFQNELEAH